MDKIYVPAKRYKTLPFKHEYTKLNWIHDGELVECIAIHECKMKDIPLEFLLKDVSPYVKRTPNGDMYIREDIYEFFEQFGYQNFDGDRLMCIYWFKGKQDIFHTIRSINYCQVGEELIVRIQGKDN
jgi:hypothetical protein